MVDQGETDDNPPNLMMNDPFQGETEDNPPNLMMSDPSQGEIESNPPSDASLEDNLNEDVVRNSYTHMPIEQSVSTPMGPNPSYTHFYDSSTSNDESGAKVPKRGRGCRLRRPPQRYSP